MLRATDCLPRLGCSTMKFTPPPGISPDVISPRWGSPPAGFSTLMTSAPQSTSTEPPEGTNIQVATSMTLTPSRGPATAQKPRLA